jgi:hypothetical protein
MVVEDVNNYRITRNRITYLLQNVAVVVGGRGLN